MCWGIECISCTPDGETSEKGYKYLNEYSLGRENIIWSLPIKKTFFK